MKTATNLVLPNLGRLALLIVGIVALVCTSCHGPHKATQAGKPATTAVTQAVDVQRLIDEAEDNGLVQVPTGRYVLPKGLTVTNRKGLRIVFKKGAAILVDDVTQNVVSIIDSEHISIENAKLGHLTPLAEYECHGNVVDVRDSTNVRIQSCDINGCGAVGVFARGSSGIVVEGSHVHRNTFNAFYLHGCRGVRIERNVVEHNANFMQAYEVDDLQMSHNVIRDNGGYWDGSEGSSKSRTP